LNAFNAMLCQQQFVYSIKLPDEVIALSDLRCFTVAVNAMTHLLILLQQGCTVTTEELLL